MTTTTRRRVVSGVAWSAPVVAFAATAPSASASSVTLCSGTITWVAGAGSAGTFTKASNLNGTFTPTNTNQPTVTIATTGGGTVNSNNLTTLNPVGALGVGGLDMQCDLGVGYANRTTWTYTFSKAVQELAFTITDIDTSNAEFVVIEHPAPTTFTQAAKVFRNTAATPPYWYGAAGSIDNSTSGEGNLGITMAGPLTTFTIAMFASQSNSGRNIYITPITYKYAC